MTIKRSFQSRQSGFTIIEIMIAVAIFTLIGLASTSVLTSVIDSDEISERRFSKLQELQRAMITIERDLLQAVPRVIRIEGQDNNLVMSGGKDLFESEAFGLGFVRAGWQNPQLMLPRSTLQSVAYRLQEGRLERLFGNYVDNVIGYEPKVRVLLTGIEDFQVSFLLEAEEDLNDEDVWEDNFSQGAIPIAVSIRIQSEEFGLIKRDFLLSSEGS
ncbi:type II secretion system protein GspJ [Aliiglaciecola sp. M165]|nr:type II secretion system minor pseudopilin GspJ [Aliiglaciecola sp. M165]TRY33273.1 type II secretion system protein GspJ [Aliiglaciecola sp. M165]